MASKCSTALVEPPVAATEAMAFSMALRVMICEGLKSLRKISMISLPALNAASSFAATVLRENANMLKVFKKRYPNAQMTFSAGNEVQVHMDFTDARSTLPPN